MIYSASPSLFFLFLAVGMTLCTGQQNVCDGRQPILPSGIYVSYFNESYSAAGEMGAFARDVFYPFNFSFFKAYGGSTGYSSTRAGYVINAVNVFTPTGQSTKCLKAFLGSGMELVNTLYQINPISLTFESYSWAAGCLESSCCNYDSSPFPYYGNSLVTMPCPLSLFQDFAYGCGEPQPAVVNGVPACNYLCEGNFAATSHRKY